MKRKQWFVVALVSLVPLVGSPAAAAGGEVVDPVEVMFFVDDTARFLEDIEFGLDRGDFGEPLPSDQDRIDAFFDRLDAFEAAPGAVTEAEFDQLFRDVDAFASEVVGRTGRPVPVSPIGSGDEPEPGGATPPVVDSAETIALARRTAALLVDEARHLVELDALEGDLSELMALFDGVGAAVEADRDRSDARADLLLADGLVGNGLSELSALDPSISPEVADTVALLPEDVTGRIEAGDPSGLTAESYFLAIEALALRSGRPATDIASVAAPGQVAGRLRDEYAAIAPTAAVTPAPSIADVPEAAEPTSVTEVPDDATRPATTETGSAVAGAEADTGTGDGSTDAASESSDGVPLGLVLVGAAILLAALLITAVRSRRRSPAPADDSPRSGFHDLLDVSRRLAPATTIAELEELAVRQAIRLTDAVAGAFVRHDARHLSVGWVSDDGLLVEDRLSEGVLDRVVGAGQEMMQISQTEPAIRNLPVSLIAAPVFASGSIVGAILLLRGTERPFDAADLALLTDLKPIVGSAYESTQHAERARADAMTDGLTGVSNRRALDLAVGDQGPDVAFAAIMVDLDHFKSVNDTHGHQSGDDLLRSVAKRITSQLRPGDRLFRYGGEEFAVMLPDTDESTAVGVAERIRAAIAEATFSIGPDAVQHRATASLGVAAGTGGDAVFGHADAALYRAKESGRNRVEAAGAAAWPAPG